MVSYRCYREQTILAVSGGEEKKQILEPTNLSTVHFTYSVII